MPNGFRSREPASDASPRVGDVHRRRICARCGSTTLATRMKIASRARYHLFYFTNRADHTGTYIEAWLCKPCSASLQGYGVLRA